MQKDGNDKVMKLSRQCVSEGEMLPPWYYGRSYSAWDLNVTYFHVIPLNYLLRLYARFNCYWNRFRSRKSWVDLQIEDTVIRLNDIRRVAHFEQEKHISENLRKVFSQLPLKKGESESLIKDIVKN